MRDLLTDPLYLPRDLGAPIPESPHAVSVCLPTWADNVGYEEQEPRVLRRMNNGYPRFVFHADCQRLFDDCRRRFAPDGWSCLAYPSERSALRLVEFLNHHAGATATVHDVGLHNVHAVCFPATHADLAKSQWQHGGEGVSSRQAVAVLEHTPAGDGTAATEAVRQRVAELSGVPVDCVRLFPTGMAAQYAVHRAVLRLSPGRRSIQFGFPYVDALKMLEKFGPGVRFCPRGDESELAELESLAAAGNQVSSESAPAAIYTEFPSNPMLLTPDLARLRGLADRWGCPLIVDDTVASFLNSGVLPLADVLWSSLTKYFSSEGDVTGGAIVLNPDSRLAGDIGRLMDEEYENLLWGDDALVLERNSRDYEPRMRQINATTETVADALRAHPAIARVSYPKYQSPERYLQYARPGAGYGGLFSLDLVDAPRTAARFYDALRLCKGPNFGMRYSLACPFTILAHYRELEFAESCGVSRYLIRVGIGLEPAAELITRFQDALDQLD